MKQTILRWFSSILLIIYTIMVFSKYQHLGSFGITVLLGSGLCFYYSYPSDTRKEMFNVNNNVPTKRAAILITVCVAIMAIMAILVYKGIVTL